MLRFERSKYLYLFSILPLLLSVFVCYLHYKKRLFQRFGYWALVIKLIPNTALVKSYIKFFIMLICTGLFVLIIAGPQCGCKLSIEKEERGKEIMICLDISNSMLSTDINPTRLEKAKQIISLLVDKLGNNKIGLIVFAGDAFIQLPITLDYISTKMFLSSIRPSMISTQGTAIGKAIHLAIQSFTANKNKTRKSIILITDGENHEDDCIKETKEAIKKDITVHVLGVGSIQGSPIFIFNNYLKDKKGNIVLTKLNENICQEIAKIGRGSYARVTDNSSTRIVKMFQKELNKKYSSNIKSREYSSYKEEYFIPAWILLFFLVIEFFISERRNSFSNENKFFNEKKI